MVSLENCKKILTKNGENYTIEQIKAIRSLLNGFAEMYINQLLKSV
tara:strand:- start:398 stop:535 length:138 start_codon:yes stop_codon:yes gene_type:complete